MEYYSTPATFSYENMIYNCINHCDTESKEYFYKRGSAPTLPVALKYLHFYAISENIITYIPRVDSIKRSTDVAYYLRILGESTQAYTDTLPYYKPLGVSKAVLNSINPKDSFSIRVVPVTGQIQDTFERYIPEWAANWNAVEALNVSLVLKMTPKHRVRVYKKDEHIIMFTTTPWQEDTNMLDLLYRKFWACIPVLRGWTDTPAKEQEYATLINLYKLLANTDATNFWNALEEAYNNSDAVKNLKYSGIIQTFNSIKAVRIESYSQKILAEQNNASHYAQEYANALARIRDAERFIMEINANDTGLELDCIKRLVDKRICYDLKITTDVNNAGGILAYRCSAPLLAYDKDAAAVCYKKNILASDSDALKKIFKLLFIDEKVILNFDEAIDIYLTRGTIQAKNGSTKLRNNLSYCFPNPHHYFYNCWGSYNTTITDLIHSYKLEELFYQVKAAIGSFNFTDYPVLSRFISLLRDVADGYYNPACFYWKDENCTALHTLSETLKHFNQEATE